MVSPYLLLPARRRREVLRDLIARLEIELERARYPANRQRIGEELRRLQDELKQTPE